MKAFLVGGPNHGEYYTFEGELPEVIVTATFPRVTAYEFTEALHPEETITKHLYQFTKFNLLGVMFPIWVINPKPKDKTEIDHKILDWLLSGDALEYVKSYQ